MRNIIFADPWLFFLLLLVPMLALWYWWRYNKRFAEIKLPSLAPFKGLGKGIRSYLRPMLAVVRMLAIGLIIVALARPQDMLKEESINADGIDIVLALDVSTSMLAEDLKPNRIESAKEVALDFISGRSNDRIGLVVFAGESYTQCPITTDKQVVQNLLTEIKSGVIKDGTAIGMGIATAVSRLKDSKAESKVIILLTDGVNNSGFIDPLTAAETAKEYDIKTYTIAVGTRGLAPYPQRTIFGGTRYQNVQVEIDEDLLKEIANMTNGKFYRATSNESLASIYQEIDQLEKTEIEVTTIKRYLEKFYVFAFLALGLLALEIILRITIFRSIP